MGLKLTYKSILFYNIVPTYISQSNVNHNYRSLHLKLNPATSYGFVEKDLLTANNIQVVLNETNVIFKEPEYN